MRLRFSLLTLLIALLVGGPAWAQQPQQEITPFTAWIDFRHVAAGQPLVAPPNWLRGVNVNHATTADGGMTTIFQISLEVAPDPNQKRLLRLYFDDVPGASPTIAGLDGSGAPVFSHGPLGQGLEMPNSDSVVFSSGGIATIDVIVPGDGHNIRGAFLATLQAQKMMRALDFVPPGDLIDVFERSAGLQLPANDLSLYGRVKATLDTGTVKLSAAQPTISWEFELQALPLLAVINLEVLAADPQTPLEITLNDQPLRTISVSWPDLADPGYLGQVIPLEPGMHFRYAGWLRAQKVIPGSALQTGVNRLVLQLPSGAFPVAVRSLELLLKHNWKNLDYNVSPTSP